MSTAGPATAAASSNDGPGSSSASLEPLSGGKSKRGEKKAGKGGRRRRSAGEQRRWLQYADDDDEDFSLVAPSLPQSARRRNSERHELRQYFNHLADDVVDADVALALSLSIAERNSVSDFDGLPASVIAGMTYESLAQLEDVRRVASAGAVTELPVCSFSKEAQVVETADDARMCVICQNDYDQGDSQVRLPCLHTFHQVCGAEWLLNYSRLCPICKHDITEETT